MEGYDIDGGGENSSRTETVWVTEWRLSVEVCRGVKTVLVWVFPRGQAWKFVGLPGGSVVNPPATAGDAKDPGSIPGSGRSPGVGKWQLAPVSLPGKFNGWGGSWRPAVYGVAKSDTTEWLRTGLAGRPVSEHSDFINGRKWVLSLSFAVVVCYSASLQLGDMLFKVFKVLFTYLQNR